MIQLPTRTPDRIAIKVKTVVEKIIRQGHPWLFEQGITKQSKEGKAGDIAIVYDKKKNQFLAIGLYDPFSVIRVKLLQVGKKAQIGPEWFEARIKTAFDKRAALLQTDTNSYRLIHGENDGFPGLVADVYADVLVIKLYAHIWLPYLATILPILQAFSQSKVGILRLSRLLMREPAHLQGLEDGQVLYGQLAQEWVQFKEHGLLFLANVIKGHKTGYFLDHRHNRKRVGELAKGRKVLDVFAYAGGFTVHALAGGAKEVTSLDISAQALEMARKNVALNFQKANHQTMAIDAFEGLAELYQTGKQFDLVIVDPPSFAKKASEVDKAVHNYTRLAKLAIQIVAKGGILLLASFSSRIDAATFFSTALDTVKKSGRKYREMERSLHDIDHPIGFKEGAYLKSIYFELDGQ